MEVERHVGLTRFGNGDMRVERKVCLAVACLLCADDRVRLSVLHFEYRAFPEGELGIRMVLDSDVQHSLVGMELHLVDVKLEPVRFVTVPRIGPNFLCPSADSDESKQDRKDDLLVHVRFVLMKFNRL